MSIELGLLMLRVCVGTFPTCNIWNIGSGNKNVTLCSCVCWQDQLMERMDVAKDPAVKMKGEDLAHAYDAVRVANKSVCHSFINLLPLRFYAVIYICLDELCDLVSSLPLSVSGFWRASCVVSAVRERRSWRLWGASLVKRSLILPLLYSDRYRLMKAVICGAWGSLLKDYVYILKSIYYVIISLS